MTKNDEPPSWERQSLPRHFYRVGIAVFVILLLGIIIGVNIGRYSSGITDPPTTTTTTGSYGSHSSNSTTGPTPPPNNTNPSSPPPPAPATTLVYGVVNPAGVNANLSLPGWTLMFNGTNGLFKASLVLQWN